MSPSSFHDPRLRPARRQLADQVPHEDLQWKRVRHCSRGGRHGANRDVSSRRLRHVLGHGARREPDDPDLERGMDGHVGALRDTHLQDRPRLAVRTQQPDHPAHDVFLKERRSGLERGYVLRARLQDRSAGGLDLQLVRHDRHDRAERDGRSRPASSRFHGLQVPGRSPVVLRERGHVHGLLGGARDPRGCIDDADHGYAGLARHIQQRAGIPRRTGVVTERAVHS